MARQKTRVRCKNVYKSGEGAALKASFTGKWIALINQIERAKGQPLAGGGSGRK